MVKITNTRDETKTVQLLGTRCAGSVRICAVGRVAARHARGLEPYFMLAVGLLCINVSIHAHIHGPH
jgi:hypothetical protein